MVGLVYRCVKKVSDEGRAGEEGAGPPRAGKFSMTPFFLSRPDHHAPHFSVDEFNAVTRRSQVCHRSFWAE
jgi:hypothetical protein